MKVYAKENRVIVEDEVTGARLAYSPEAARFMARLADSLRDPVERQRVVGELTAAADAAAQWWEKAIWDIRVELPAEEPVSVRIAE